MRVYHLKSVFSSSSGGVRAELAVRHVSLGIEADLESDGKERPEFRCSEFCLLSKTLA